MSESAELRRRRRWPRRRWLNSVRLNLAGWGALLTACLVTGAMGAALAGVLGFPRAVGAVVGALLVPALVMGYDRYRSGRLRSSVSWTDDPSEVELVSVELRKRGLLVDVLPGELVGPEPQPPSLMFRSRDRRKVFKALHQIGVSMDYGNA